MNRLVGASLWRVILPAVAIACGACGASPSPPAAGGSGNLSAASIREESHGSPVAAEVNGVKLYMAAYEQAVDYIRARLSESPATADIERYVKAKDEGLDMIVNDELLYQEARRAGVTVTDDQLADEFARIAREAGGEGRFLMRMEAEGFTPYEAIEGIRKKLTIDSFVTTSVTAGLKATDDEMLRYYNAHLDRFTPQERVKAQHILVSLPPNPDAGQVARARQRADQILANIRVGRPFEALAREFSEDASAEQGGHLGLLKRGSQPPEFDALAFNMSPGEVSAPVRTYQGFHIIKVLERHGDRPRPFEDVKEDCRAAVRREKQKEAIGQVVARLRATAEIVSHVEQ